jgi:hypothetical protein
MIDTLQIADQLAEGGVFTRDQAERLARVSVRTAGEALVTKADLSATESALKADLSGTESALRGEISALRGDLGATESALRGEIGALKVDLRATEAAIRSDMALMESRLETVLERGQKRLVMWFAGIMVMHATAVIGLTVGLIKLL